MSAENERANKRKEKNMCLIRTILVSCSKFDWMRSRTVITHEKKRKKNSTDKKYASGLNSSYDLHFVAENGNWSKQRTLPINYGADRLCKWSQHFHSHCAHTITVTISILFFGTWDEFPTNILNQQRHIAQTHTKSKWTKKETEQKFNVDHALMQSYWQTNADLEAIGLCVWNE